MSAATLVCTGKYGYTLDFSGEYGMVLNILTQVLTECEGRDGPHAALGKKCEVSILLLLLLLQVRVMQISLSLCLLSLYILLPYLTLTPHYICVSLSVLISIIVSFRSPIKRACLLEVTPSWKSILRALPLTAVGLLKHFSILYWFVFMCLFIFLHRLTVCSMPFARISVSWKWG